MKTFRTMLKTELRLSFRGMDMFIFAICLPVVALVIFGIIYGNKPAFEGAEYTFLEQSVGALSAISICAGGVMGLPLIVSDYRSKGILKRYKVTPISSSMILFVQVVVYTLYSIVSFLLLYLVSAVLFNCRFLGDVSVFLGGYLLVIVSMFSIGIMVGGIAPNTKMAGVIASILYFPMLIFSGATLPYEIMPSALQKISDVLPLTHGIKLLKAGYLGLEVDSVIVPGIIMLFIAFFCTAVSLKYFKWE